MQVIQFEKNAQEKHKEQRKVYYSLNKDKIAANSRVRYQRRTGANSGDLDEQ